MAYDQNNIFARILRGEIPNKTVYEDDHVLAFEDIHPQAPVHVLMIPKGAYVDMVDFSENATDPELSAYARAIGRIAAQLGLSEGGVRTISNNGTAGSQDVPHPHTHILGGRLHGRMLRAER